MRFKTQGLGYSLEINSIDLDDSPDENVRPHFDKVHGWINKSKDKGESCLVVCTAGVSRSVTFVISYLMKF